MFKGIEINSKVVREDSQFDSMPTKIPIFQPNNLNSHQALRSNAQCVKCSKQQQDSKANKKTHYTIRRGPGKISHLLSTPQTDLLIGFKSEQSNQNVLI